MNITSKQAHVLSNLNRVVPYQSKLKTVSSRPRYQLDGMDCTAQIRSLIVRNMISAYATGQFRRRNWSEKAEKVQRIGERKPPLAASLAQIKACLSSPDGMRVIGSGKR